MRGKKIWLASVLVLGGAVAGAILLALFLRADPEAGRRILEGSAPVPEWKREAERQTREAEQERERLRAEAQRAEEEDPFGGDPFAVARKFQEEMEKQMRKGFADLEEEAAGAGGLSQSVVRKEDERSVSYEIHGVEGNSLSTQVQNGYLSITAQVKRQTGGTSFSSSFHQSFPLPPDVDAAGMETISEKDKVVLRFPKKNG